MKENTLNIVADVIEFDMSTSISQEKFPISLA